MSLYINAGQTNEKSYFPFYLVVAFLAAWALLVFINHKYPAPVANTPKQSTQLVAPIACPQIAMQCPDGSYVSQSGPSCEFAKCPKISK